MEVRLKSLTKQEQETLPYTSLFMLTSAVFTEQMDQQSIRLIDILLIAPCRSEVKTVSSINQLGYCCNKVLKSKLLA